MALKTKTFAAGGTADVRGYTIRLKLTEESVNVSGNSSLVSYVFSIAKGADYGFYTGPYFSWSIQLGGRTIPINSFAFDVRGENGKEQVIASGQLTVEHSPEGTLDMPFSLSIPDTRRVSPSYGPPEIRLSGSWALTAIPRVSSLSAVDTCIGENACITVFRANSGFTHTITYAFGKLSGTIAEKTGETTLQWRLPEDFYQEIPDAKSGTVTLTCQTYAGDTPLGAPATAAFQAIASQTVCKPEIVGALTITDETTLALTDGQAIRYISTILAVAEATGKHHATITRVMINGVEAEKQADGRYRAVFERAEAWHYVFQVWDSRGYSNSTYVDMQMHDYLPFTCIPTVRRAAPTSPRVLLSLRGSFWAKNFSAENANELLLKCCCRKRGEMNWGPEHTFTPQVDGQTHTYTADLEIAGEEKDYEAVWEWQIYGQDRAMHLTQLVVLPKGLPIYDWGEQGFNFNVPIFFREKEIDLVIDEGTSGIWSYRKWASGKAACWGTDRRTVVNWGSNSWGGVYNCANVSLPFGFAAVAAALANAACGTAYAPCFGDVEEIQSTNVANFNCNLPVTGQQTILTNMLVVGRWK